MKEFDRFIQIKTNKVKPTKGHLLLSEPLMGDFYFGRSVVLLAEHNAEGSFGVILNKPVEARLNDVVKDFPPFDTNIYIGGPVDTNSLFYLHTLGKEIEGSIEIIDNLYWGGDLNIVKEKMLLNTLDKKDIRFFIGYSGWSENQLESELKRNSWLISSASKDVLLEMSPERMWRELVDLMGSEYKFWNKLPVDPTMN